ncbi:glutamic acid-rich protein-like isoform X2 [Chenopodium quinoa]|uniref:glutamic acid-rich protein-like isoform X2 n=1 Tax=Chenopodium quinoa TaxID=63459 RepID=UPI000B78F889|nr:glutamic acid-rich protein-like isoform X2 [Chenopodium quinoa]
MKRPTTKQRHNIITKLLILERDSKKLERRKKMGSSFKNINNHNHNQRGSSSISKPYALILLLAFGAAILGVMVLHKIREKHIFTHLVKEKDHELLTLHLLFQREKEFNQEARKKIEEMNSKAYSLRTQKLELDRRLSEMESMISSLRDERKVIELTLEEKKNKIQILTEGKNSSSEDPPQVTVLKDMLKMKDAEIEDLKFQLEKREDLHSETTRLVTSSISVGTRDEGDLQLSSDSFTDSTMGDSRSHNDNVIQRVNDHSTNIELEKLNDVKDGVELKNEDTKTDDKETADYHAEQGTKVNEDKAKETNTSHDEEKQKLQEHQTTDSLKDTSLLRGGQMLEKPDTCVSGYGSRARRRHSKGKRREVLRNRRLGDDLYTVSKTGSTPVLNRNEEQQKFDLPRNNESEIKKYLREKHHIPDTRNDGQSREEDAKKSKERGMKLKEIQSNRTEETEQVYEHGRLVSTEQNKIVKTKLLTDDEGSNIDDVQSTTRKQSSDEITSQLHDQEENWKQEKISSIEVKKQEIDNEQGNEIVIEESDAEDSEDAETNEPEIDRDDIRRFSESDPDEEAEETEF